MLGRATDFEFRYRFWVIMAIFAAGFWCYRFDPVNAGMAFAGWLAGHRLELDRLGDRHLLQGVCALAAALAVLAALVRTWGAAYLRSDVVHDLDLHTEGLVADGPYRYVRNPLYLGGVLLALSLGILASRLGFLVLVAGLTLFYNRLIGHEEALLLETQGEPYRRFLAAVPRLVPSLRPRLPAGGMKPRWGQAWLGEAPMWIMACSVIAFAATLKPQVFYSVIGIALVGYAIRIAVVARRKRAAAAEQ
jgi:protein-S-isoprenylcysteine O-methyltransferase Ste14